MLKKESPLKKRLTRIFIYDDVLDPSTEEYNDLISKSVDEGMAHPYRDISGVICKTEGDAIYVKHSRDYGQGIYGLRIEVTDEQLTKINKFYTDRGFLPRIWDTFIYYTLSQELESSNDVELEDVTNWMEHKQYLKDIKANPNGTEQLSLDSLKPDLNNANMAEMLEEGYTLSQARKHSKPGNDPKNIGGGEFLEYIRSQPAITVKKPVGRGYSTSRGISTSWNSEYKSPGIEGHPIMVDLSNPMIPEEAVERLDNLPQDTENSNTLPSAKAFNQASLAEAMTNLYSVYADNNRPIEHPEELNPEN